jgi:uncharacterized protein
MLSSDAKLTAEFRPDLLNGVEVVRTRAYALAYDAQGKVLRSEQDFTAIPYYAWANRGRGQMMVWLPDSEENAKPAAFPTVASTAKVSASNAPRGKNPHNVADGEEPASSAELGAQFDWWPAAGSAQWIEYAFEKAATVSQAEVYWFDDTGGGGCKVPASWRLVYKDGEQWKPVENLDPYGVARNKYNKVTFKPVTTAALRIELQMQPGSSTGIQEWKVK